MAALRSAESTRISTCEFGDRVARLVNSVYQSSCPDDLLRSYKQTVLAGFVMHDASSDELSLVSFAVGTKFVHWDKMKLTNEQSMTINLEKCPTPANRIPCSKVREDCSATTPYLHVVRDCHAEILARRALLKYFYEQIATAIKQSSCDGEDAVPSVFELIPRGDSNNNSNTDMFAHQRFRLRPGLTLHFYSSSQPCGNSSNKNWAKGSAHVQECSTCSDSSNISARYPHPMFHPQGVAQGQVACSVKKDSFCSVRVCSTGHNATGSGVVNRAVIGGGSSDGYCKNSGNDKFESPCGVAVDVSGFKAAPPGTSWAGSSTALRVRADLSCDSSGTAFKADLIDNEPKMEAEEHLTLDGVLMTCSDKIAKWCALGVQGALLSYLVGDSDDNSGYGGKCGSSGYDGIGNGDAEDTVGIYISSITVGRKFSAPHLQRAICCRIRQFQYPTEAAAAVTNKLSRSAGSCDAGSDRIASTLSNSATAKRRCVNGRFRTHHPATLCTSVKFDNSAIVTGCDSIPSAVTSSEEPITPPSLLCAESVVDAGMNVVGAQFDEPRCLAAWKTSSASGTVKTRAASAVVYHTEVIDGSTGRLYVHGDKTSSVINTNNHAGTDNDGASALCSASLYNDFVQVLVLIDSQWGSYYKQPSDLSIEDYMQFKQSRAVSSMTTADANAVDDVVSSSDSSADPVVDIQKMNSNQYVDAKMKLLRYWGGLTDHALSISDSAPPHHQKRNKLELCAHLSNWISVKQILWMQCKHVV